MANVPSRNENLYWWLRHYASRFWPEEIIEEFNEEKIRKIAKRWSLEGLVFDVSGTLIPSFKHQPKQKILQGLVRLSHDFKIGLVSDITRPYQARMVKRIATAGNCHFWLASPLPKLFLIPLIRAQRIMGIDVPGEIAMIGDGRTRDIVPANTLGWRTIMIESLLPGCGTIKNLRKRGGKCIKRLVFGL